MGRYYSGDIEGKFWVARQDSDDANHFGGMEDEILDEETGECVELAYYFETKDLPDINLGIRICLDALGEYKEKLDAFFASVDEYDPEDIAAALGVSEEAVDELLEQYARLMLGEQIRECVEKQGECRFTAEIE